MRPRSRSSATSLLHGRLVRESAAPYCVRWVRRFLSRPAVNEPLADQARRFCEELERDGQNQDWQEYLRHANVETAMVYTPAVRDLRSPPRSPLDVMRSRTGGLGLARDYGEP